MTTWTDCRDIALLTIIVYTKTTQHIDVKNFIPTTSAVTIVRTLMMAFN